MDVLMGTAGKTGVILADDEGVVVSKKRDRGNAAAESGRRWG